MTFILWLCRVHCLYWQTWRWIRAWEQSLPLRWNPKICFYNPVSESSIRFEVLKSHLFNKISTFMEFDLDFCGTKSQAPQAYYMKAFKSVILKIKVEINAHQYLLSFCVDFSSVFRGGGMRRCPPPSESPKKNVHRPINQAFQSHRFECNNH